ncbi:MAG: Holliday junction resolvase RuvX [Candidatus Aphodocola sp.]
MRIIGLDLGTKTLGVAVSDNTETISTGLTTLRFEENKPEMIIDDLKEIINYYNADLIVIGLPKNMNNTLGDAVFRTREFIKILNNNFDIKVVEQDERLSSVSANNLLISADVSRKKRKKKVDEVAATIILQNYLDIRKGIENG